MGVVSETETSGRTVSSRVSSYRLSEVAKQEMAQLAPAALLAHLLMAPLPPLTGNRVRAALLRAAGFQIGRGTLIFGPIRFTGARDPASRVRIGSGVVINIGCLLDVGAEITIGNRVGIGQDVIIMTNRHRIGSHSQRLGSLESLPVRIDDGAWLSTRALVLPGITIGAGAVVAAGAVVTRSVPPDVLVAGTPARVVRRLPE